MAGSDRGRRPQPDFSFDRASTKRPPRRPGQAGPDDRNLALAARRAI